MNLYRLENLYKNFEKNGNWYYKQISSSFYIMFGWFQDVPVGETYYNLPVMTVSEYTNSIVLTSPTGTNAVKPATAYIKSKKIYINNINSSSVNYSIFAIVQV